MNHRFAKGRPDDFSARGMTLLEVMIALAIMATLMAFSSSSIQQALTSKLKIQTQLDDMSRVRDALRIIERDVNLAFHYQDLETEFREGMKKSFNPQPGVPGQVPPQNPSPTGGAPQPPVQYNDPKENERRANRVKPETDFVGAEDNMYFPTLNSGRISETALQADFIKVGYFLEECARPGKNRETVRSKCLFRRQSSIVEGDPTKGGDPVVLLENIAEFKLRYKGPGKQDWISDWKSNGGDGGAKGKFPSLVEISLTTEKGTTGKPKRISMQIVVPVRFPNNDKPGQPGSQQPPRIN